MSSVRDIITISIMAGIGLAIILNAENAVKIVGAVSDTWIGLIQAVSNTGSK